MSAANKSKRPQRKYQDKERVYVQCLGRNQIFIITGAKHNGLQWMYSFEGTDARVGESYVSAPSFAKS